MSEPARAPRRASRRAAVAALAGAIIASAFVLAPVASVAAYDGGDTYVYFSTQPLGASWGYTPTGQPGVPWSIQPVVSIDGYPADANYNYTATLSVSGGGYGSLSCSGGTTIQMYGSDAYFRGCSIDSPGQGYTLSVSVFGTTDMGMVLPPMTATSLPFNIAGGGPQPGQQTLQFTTQPLGANLGGSRPSAQAGRIWSIQPVVALVDQYGRPVDNDSTVVQLAITGGTPQSGGPGRLTCTGGTATTLQNGVAYFSGCSIDTPGTAYQLTASTMSWGSTQILYDQSLAFDITGGNYASQIMFNTQPMGATNGGNIPSSPTGTPWTIQPSVALLNSTGKILTNDYSSIVSLSIAPGSPSGSLYCASGTSVQVAAGIAYFQGCQIVGPGNGYRLNAYAQTSTGQIGPALSLPFTITAAPTGLSLESSSYKVSPGTIMTFTATLSGAGAGQTIIFEGKNANYTAWTQFGTAQTNSQGVAVLTPSKPIQYTATVRARYAGSGAYAPATSTEDYIGVVASVSIKPSGSTTVKKGTSVTYTATLAPDPGPGQKVQFLIYKWDGSAWVYNNQRTYFTDQNSQVKLTWKWGSTGKWYVRAYAWANQYYTAGYSPTSVVTVK